MSARPNWSAARRNELDAEKLRALGVTDYGGKSASTVWRNLPAATKREGVSRLSEKRPSYAGGGANVRTKRERIIQVGEARVRVVNSSDRTYLKRQLRQAARDGQNVQVYATWKTETGYATQVHGSSKEHTHASPRTGDRAEGKIRIVIGDPSEGGIPARQVVADMANYDSFDEYLADEFDHEEAEGSG